MSKSPYGDIVSTPQLSAWRCGRGVCRIQTAVPKIAAKLARLRDTREVVSVNGQFLRLFDSTQRPNRLQRLLTARLISANSLDECTEQEASVVR